MTAKSDVLIYTSVAVRDCRAEGSAVLKGENFFASIHHSGASRIFHVNLFADLQVTAQSQGHMCSHKKEAPS